MRIYHNADGSVMGTWGGINDPFVSYDSHTNPTLASAINADAAAYRVINGTLTRDGEHVTIAPPCEDCQTLDSLDSATTVEQLRKVLILLRDKPGFTRG